MRKRIIGAVCMTALASGAAEPVWPTDFVEKLAANRAAARPGEGQVAESGGTIATSMRKWFAAFSEFVVLSTKMPTGLTLNFR